VANLCPSWTFTNKNLYALLGALIFPPLFIWCNYSQQKVICQCLLKKCLLPKKVAGGFSRNIVLLSHSIATKVPSALEGLTTVFGMGTGVAPLVKMLRKTITIYIIKWAKPYFIISKKVKPIG